MEIKQLKYFLSVTELGSFSKAAVSLSVAQPVLSRQIRCLEDELGIELLYRNGRGIVVTDAGQILLNYARTIVDSTRSIAMEIDSMRADPIGKVVIGLPPTASVMMTVPLVQRFRQIYPKVKLKVEVGYSGHVLEWLSTGRIDVAVLYNAPKTSTLTTQPLLEEELLLIGPKDAPEKYRGPSVAASDIAGLPMILPSHPHGLRILVDTLLGSIGIQSDVVFEIDNLSACLELVERGLGYTILPFASVAAKVHAGELVATAMVEPRMTRQLVLATSTQRPTTNVTRALARTVSQLARDLIQEGVWIPRVGR